MTRKTPRIAVIQYPGTNCEYETAWVVESAGMTAEIFRWNRNPSELPKFDGFVIPGGFSYQDRIRAGVIAAKKSIMEQLILESKKQKPILGICNGAQILIEGGLVPGIREDAVEMSLAANTSSGRSSYLCDWVFVQCSESNTHNAFSSAFTPGQVIPIPIAHAEGRFTTQDQSVLERIQANKQIGFRYCTAGGDIDPEFPINPNGSRLNIAGLYNPQGNVLALMPHPERCALSRHIPGDILGIQTWLTPGKSGPGTLFFESMKRYILGITS